MITKNSVVKIQNLVVDHKPLSWTLLYEDTNAHGYLPYNSAHRKYCRVNLLYNPAKCSIVFVSNDEKVEMRLKEFKNWLKNCHYPDNGINQSFYNAKLQGPAPSEDTLKNIPFITTYYENIDDKKVIKKFVLNCEIFSQDIVQKYLKMKMLFFHESNRKTYSDY